MHSSNVIPCLYCMVNLLTPSSIVIFCVLLQAPTPNPAMYNQNRKQRITSHGPMDKYMQPCTRPVCRLRSVSAPVIRERGTRTNGLSATSTDGLLTRRKSVRGQGDGMPSRSHSAQVHSTSRVAPALHGAQSLAQAPQSPLQRNSETTDQLAAMAENIWQAPAPEAKRLQIPLMGAHAPQASHGPITRSRSHHSGALQPIATCSNSPMPLPISSSGPDLGNLVYDGKKSKRSSWSKRRGMGTSLSADQTLGHRHLVASGRRLRSPHANDHFTTACTRRRSDSPAADVCMDVDSSGEVPTSSAADGHGSPARSGCKQNRTPLRKQNANVMKAVRSSRQPMPRTRSASHAYKLRSRSRPQAADHDSSQTNQCDTY